VVGGEGLLQQGGEVGPHVPAWALQQEGLQIPAPQPIKLNIFDIKVTVITQVTNLLPSLAKKCKNQSLIDLSSFIRT
jgi:hypothetical protein